MPSRTPVSRMLPAVLAVLCALSCAAEQRTLLILHTNDLHDHLRPGYDGTGGFAHLSGYAAAQRRDRTDLLLLDGGDVTEKGDLAAFKTQGTLSYEAMARIGYQAVVPGNHDFSHGLEALRGHAALLGGTAMLCANLRDREGGEVFPASKIFEVNGLRAGVIGVTTDTNDAPVFAFAKTVEAVRAEAARLRGECDVLIVLAHLGSRECQTLAEAAPEVDLFVGGHTHELLREPIRTPGGAVIVQAGQYAEHAGRVELTADTERRDVRVVNAEVVPLAHDKVPCDGSMLAWLRGREAEVCPEAAEVVGRNAEEISGIRMAWLAAAALRKHGGADLAFCHPRQVMRGSLPKGEVDANALFRTGGQRGSELVRAQLTGAQVVDYFKGLREGRLGVTALAGADPDALESALSPGKTYQVILPRLEWTTRLAKVLRDVAAPEPCPFTFLDAVTAYTRGITAGGQTIDAHVRTLRGGGEE